MKKLVIVLLSIALANSAFAYDTAKLKVKVANDTSRRDAYFICLPGPIGCVNIKTTKTLPMDVGQVNSIFAANFSNLQMYAQELPTSCQVNVAKDQTLTVSGKLVVEKGKGNVAHINELHCSVA